MKRFACWLKKNWFYIVAFLIPWITMIVHGLMYDTWITGNGGELAGDIQKQYIQLFEELWTKLHEGRSLFHSWNAFGGYDFYSNMTFYLLSPFTIIILLVPKLAIPYAIQYVMFTKWALTSVSMTYYFYHTKNNRLVIHKELVSCVLGIAFALGTGMIYYMSYISFMDVLMIFPMLLLLTERMIDDGQWGKFYLLLLCCLLSNYYMVYHVGVFLFFWFIIHIDKNTQYPLKKIITFIGSSALAVCSAAVVVLPSILAVGARQSDYDVYLVLYIKKILNGFSAVIERFFIFEEIISLASFSPCIYISIIFVMLVCFYCCIRYDRRKQYCVICLALFLFSGFFSGAVSLFWHGFMIPHGFHNRFVNMFTFVLLYMVLQVITDLRNISKRQFAIVFVCQTIVLLYVFFTLDSYVNVIAYVATLLLFIFYIIIFVLYNRKSISLQGITVFIAVMALIELCVNVVYVLQAKDSEDYYTFLNRRDMIEAAEQVKLEPGERILLEPSFENDGMCLDLPTESGFLSYCDYNYNNMIGELGYFDSAETSSTIFCSSPLINVIYNLVYGIGRDGFLLGDSKIVSSGNDYSVYKANRTIGLGYMVDRTLLEWNGEGNTPFDVQNDFIQKAVKGERIYDIIHPDIWAFTADQSFDSTKDETNGITWSEDGNYHYQYPAQSGGVNDSLQLRFVAEEDMDLYVSRDSNVAFQEYIFIDDEEVYFDIKSITKGMYHVGNVKKGQQIDLLMFVHDAVDPGTNVDITISFANFNEEAFEQAYRLMSSEAYDIIEMTDDSIYGRIHAEEDGLMMTSIHHMNGFSVYVDGKEFDYELVNDTMYAIPLSKGDHEISFVYRQPYFIQGLVISIISIVLYLMLIYFKNKTGSIV